VLARFNVELEEPRSFRPIPSRISSWSVRSPGMKFLVMDGCHQHHPTSTIIITGFGDNGVGEACCCRQLLAEDSDVITLLLELFTVLFVNDVSLGFLVVSFLSQDDASCQGERKSDVDISYQEYRNFKNRTCVMSYFDVL
jgi:hypothetical protein